MDKILGYPKLSKRIQALLFDSLIIPILVIGTLLVISSFGIHGAPSALIAGIIIFALEPLLVSTTGGSIGHHITGIQVKNNKTHENLNIFMSSIRFIIKIPLGMFSLISVLTTKHHQGIHDLFVDSIVIIKNLEATPKTQILSERVIEEIGYIYPSKLRRIIVMIPYILILLFVTSTIYQLSISIDCFDQIRCSDTDKMIGILVKIVWIVGIFLTVSLCWKGRLFGCLRHPSQ